MITRRFVRYLIEVATYIAALISSCYGMSQVKSQNGSMRVTMSNRESHSIKMSLNRFQMSWDDFIQVNMNISKSK